MYKQMYELCIGIGSGIGGLVSRPMQRKLVTLLGCQLVEPEGRARALRAARSLGERTVTELILQHQNPQQLSANLWAAVRARGCQFLGPGKLACLPYLLTFQHFLTVGTLRLISYFVISSHARGSSQTRIVGARGRISIIS